MQLNKKEIKKIIKKSDWDYTEPNNLALAELSRELERNELIDFSIEFREDASEAWLQVEYYNKTLQKSIIIDYDFIQSYENIDAFIETLEEINQEIQRINKHIN